MNDDHKVDVAVALHWDGAGVPRVTAKGRGEVAERIAAIARHHDVPINDDPDLVQVLASVPLGNDIPEALFVAVAEVIAFAYRLRAQSSNLDYTPPAEKPAPGR